VKKQLTNVRVSFYFLRVKKLSQDGLKEILARYKTVAIVGLSRDRSKDSHRVAEYLEKHGFHIVPINPVSNENLEEKSYESLIDMLAEVQKTLEIVDFFKPSEDVLPIVNQMVQSKNYGAPYVI
jgi:hypothetical protein